VLPKLAVRSDWEGTMRIVCMQEARN
jgi:hypothetical protein